MSTDLSPLSAAALVEPGVKAWWASVRPQADKLAGVPDELKSILQRHITGGNEIEINGHLSKEGKLELVQKLRAESIVAIDKLYADAEKAMIALTHRIDGALAPAALGAQEALVEEMQVMRAWARVKGLFDVDQNQGQLQARLEKVALEAASAPGGAGRPTLKALREELPAYLTARRLGTQVESTLQRLQQIEAPFLSPVQRAALQLRSASAGGWGRLVAAFEMARRGVLGTGGNPSQLPGFYVPHELSF